ncbi:hypothetical protein ACFLZQ_01530 [Thermodesulfobacteriota bacterium]
MKRIMLIALVLVFTLSTVTAFAAGGKNQGTTGSGTTSTGTDSNGTASQPRTGR